MALPSSSTTLTLNSITYQEDGKGYLVELAGKPQGRRVFHTEWIDRFDFAKELKGYYYSDGGNPPKYVQVPPQTFPGYEQLACVRTLITGRGTQSVDDDENPSFSFAKIEAVYEELEYTPGTSDETEEIIATLDINFKGEFLTFNDGAFQWSTGSAEITHPVNIGKLVPYIDRSYTRRNVPSIPYAQISAALGHVNDAAWPGDANSYQAVAGSLLFVGATSRGTLNADGERSFDITYNLLEKPVRDSEGEAVTDPWQKFYNIKTGKWDYVQVKQATPTNWTPFGTTSFATLMAGSSG